MAYNKLLAERVRNYLANTSPQSITEKKMFGGLAFLIDGKMCINVSGEELMCRFDPAMEQEVQKKPGYLPVIMKGRAYKGYCKVKETGFKSDADFKYWITLCLDFNEKAKSSRTK